ncbi:MAG: Gfo/Idh/MocA family oxidoreductase [Candidatus Eremiobacteraeota bacterium]|nr:Gfo/Idh/MocA family oxidoreductase [Candidatus Eremiobacteraeota bacterium]
MSVRQARVGVAGAGKWGMNVVRTLAKLGSLAAVCDADLRPLEDIRSHYDNVRVFCDYATMLRLAKLDAVAIAAPAPMHAALALQAIDAGMHVFVEKPLALCVEDAERVVDAAKSANVKLVVGHVLLYHPAVQWALRAIREGRIGDVRHFRSRRLSWGRLRSHEDVWWSFAPHDVAVMLEVFGEAPHSATAASGAFVRPHVGDVAYADFRFSMGRTAHVEVAWIDPEKRSGFDVFGSRGTISFSDGSGGPRVSLTPCGDRLNARGEPELWRGETECPEIPPAEPLTLELDAFCRAIRGGRMPPTDGEEGLAVVRTLAMAGEYPSAFRMEAIS